MEKYPYVEELANALTHGAGAVLFLVLSPILLAMAVQTNLKRKMWGAGIFSFGLLSVYFSSAIYHAIPDKFTKEILNYFDYLSIFLLIGGSYTAFILFYFRNKLGNFLLLLIWVVSAFGISFKLMYPNASFVYSLIIYLALGWVGVVLVKPALRKVQSRILWLILAGGLFYTSGTYFFYHDDLPYYHAIWHMFVIFGSVNHWVAVMLGVRDKLRK